MSKDIVYFIHPVSTYNEKFETECIEKIKNEFGNVDIINPHTDIKINEEDKKKLSGSLDDYVEMMKKYFFPAIDKCNIAIVFAENYQNYPDGTFREIQYAKSKGKIVIEWWQIDRIDFYLNSGALDFIKKFFDVKKGVRCAVGHEKDMYKLKHDPAYRIWENNKCRGYTLPDSITGKFSTLKDYWCMHSYMYIFNPSVLKWNRAENSKAMFRDNRVGLCPVIDLDTPEDTNSDKAKRLTFFDYIEEFDAAIEKIISVIEEISKEATKKTGIIYPIKYNIQFSGNGIYIYLEEFYGNTLLTKDGFRDNFINLIDRLKENEGLGNEKKVHVCNKKAAWSKFFKIPFTFHETRPRISIPLPKGKLDGKWIDKVSNVNNIMKDYTIVNKIIDKAGWEKLW